MMKEITQILDAYSKIDFKDQKAALATVVHVEGSSYRRPGARMLITDDGCLTGAISGGCLEGDTLRKARLVMLQGKAAVVKYDTTDEDDNKFGIGLGCNGIIHILIEPVFPGKLNNPIELLLKMQSVRQQSVLVTLFSLENQRSTLSGTYCLYTENGQKNNSIIDPDLRNMVEYDVFETFKNNCSSFRDYKQHHLTGFIELIQPAIALVILGAGNDVIPVTEMAHILGWEVTVIDGRPSHAKAERFPMAKRVLIAKPEQVLSLIDPDQRTFFILMTHNYHYDLGIFKELMLRKVRYIGVLGPKKKLQKMLQALPDNKSAAAVSFVYGPVGLDIGAEAAEEIALSIIAEIKAVAAGREGRSLRDIPETIHQRASQIGTLAT